MALGWVHTYIKLDSFFIIELQAGRIMIYLPNFSEKIWACRVFGSGDLCKLGIYILKYWSGNTYLNFNIYPQDHMQNSNGVRVREAI